MIVAFGGSCEPISDVTSTLEIPAGAAAIETDDLGLVHVTFDAAVPDFSTFNSSADLPFFSMIDVQMVYNPTASTAGGLKPGVGTLDVLGNANLCGLITASQQCFILDLGSTTDDPAALSCVCVKPSVTDVDVTSIFAP